MSTSTAPSVAQTLLYTVARARVLEGAWQMLGLGAPGETTTLAALEAASSAAILGDGTTANPGLGSAAWQALVSDRLKSAASGARWDSLFARQAQLIRVLDDLVQSSIPSGWRFAAARPFDGFLARLNGAAGAPPTPAGPGALTAAQTAAGALPNTPSGSAPRIVHTLVGASDELESLPTAEATQTAIAGANNSYSYQIAGVVPAGISKVRVYRSAFGSAGAPYGWDQDVPVTPAAAYPPISLLQPDSQIRWDWQPPVWMQCAVRPAAAALFALAYAAGSGVGLLTLSAAGMLSPGNVLVGPANGFIGLGNPVQSVLFGQSHLTALNTSAFSAGGIQMVNSAPRGVQGFAGAMNRIQARCTQALNGTLAPTIGITYCDAAHGWGAAQTAGGLTPTTGFTTGLVGDTALFTIPSGQLVQAVNESSVSGTATSGAWVYEAG